MTERGRRAAFVFAAVLVGAVVVAMSLLGPAEEEPADVATRRAPAPPPRPVVLGSPDGPKRAPEEREHDHGDHARHAEDLPPGARRRDGIVALADRAEARARDFLDAFLRYEVEGESPPVRAAIERLASAPLAGKILDSEPRPVPVGPAPKPGRIAELRVETVDSERATVTATIARGRRVSGLLLTLRMGPSGWLVTDLG